MDIGDRCSPPTGLRRSQSQPKTNTKQNVDPETPLSARPSATTSSMVDNKGWRKKIGGKSKELPPIKTNFDENSVATSTDVLHESTDRRRHHGWRKTLSAGRTVTPITPVPVTPIPEDIDDTRSEQSGVSTVHRDSRPKAMHYTSLFVTHEEEYTGPIFSEPWGTEAPASFRPTVDPIVTMESIHSHMSKNYMEPIPLEYNSGLFRIFEDYRKLRKHKDRLKALEQEAREELKRVKAHALESEVRYEAEIRRIELLIARGTTGMAGLMQARQATVVDRKRRHRKTTSADRVPAHYHHMSPRDVDEEIRAKVQQVLLHRPISPSEGMAALSRQLTHAGPRELPIGAPSAHDQGPTLSRKVQSELNLMDLRGTEPLQDSLDVVTPGPLEGTELPSEETKVSPGSVIEDAIHCDALVALKELGALVARRKGLDVSDFLTKFVALLSAGSTKKIPEELVPEAPTLSCNTEAQEDRADDGVTGVPPQQKLQSELQIGADPECRRRFSFEPGDDQVQEVEVSLGSYDALSPTDSTDSESSSPKGLRAFIEGLQMEDGDDNDSDDDLDPLVLSSSPDTPKPSLIPCPVQTIGRVRRENSVSSLQSLSIRSVQDERRHSRASVQTAFREISESSTSSAMSKSRSSLNNKLRATELHSTSKDQPDNSTSRHSTAALAAARAAQARSVNPSGSSTQLSTAVSSTYKVRAAGSENKNPNTRNGASK